MKEVIKELGKVIPTVEGDWDINKKYELLSIVYDTNSNKSYISKKDVPIGISILNKEYWGRFSNNRIDSDSIIILSHKNDLGQINSYTLEEAITTISDDDKRIGMFISFYEKPISADGNYRWNMYQFNSDSVEDWNDINYWYSIYYIKTKFFGLQETEEALYGVRINPDIGDYAFVGMTLKDAVIYRCRTKNVWTRTNEPAIDYITVMLKGNITVGPNGNWFENGVDTGIKAQGPKGDKGDSIKGDKGDTPVMRLDKPSGYVQYGYDGIHWENLVPLTEFVINNNPDDEDIIADDNDKLKFADKSYDVAQFSGLGRKYLRRNIQQGKNILTQDMINQENTIYIIQYDYDLNGAEITIPNNCTLQFEGGSLSNGTINFNNTVLKGNYKFNNCYLNNKIISKNLSDDNFIGNTNYDINILRFLINNCAYNNTILNITRDYTITFENIEIKPNKGRNFVYIENNNGFTINFNNHKINDNIFDENNHYFISLDNCNNINVLNLEYNSIYPDFIQDPYEKDSANGAVPIKTSGDCGNCVFYIIGNKVGAIVRAGDFGDWDGTHGGGITPNYVHKGLYNSRIVVNGYRVGYALAIYTGENLDIISRFNYAHRGIYLTGVKNSSVNGKGANVTTPVILLLGESVYYDEEDITYSNPLFRCCSDIKANIVDIGSINKYTTGVHINSYDEQFHFSERKNSLNWDNINISINRENLNNSTTSFSALIVNLTNNKNDSCNILLHDSILNNTNNLCKTSPTNAKQIITFNNIISDGTIFINDTNDKNENFININNSNIKQITIYNKDATNNIKINNSNIKLLSSTVGNITNTSLELINTNLENKTIEFVKKISINNKTLNIINSLDFINNNIQNNSYIEISDNTTLKINPSNCAIGLNMDIYVKSISDINIYLSLNQVYWLNNGKSTTVNIAPRGLYKITLFKNSDNKIYAIINNLSYYGFFIGSSSTRPKAPQGVMYYDITLKKPIYSNGIIEEQSNWIFSDGLPIDTKYTGTFIEKPLASTGIPNGFAYFCTDKQTTEGQANGIMIYHKGSNVWVDALGRTIS